MIRINFFTVQLIHPKKCEASLKITRQMIKKEKKDNDMSPRLE